MKAADVRFYVDADILGLGHVLAALRSDVTYPGDPGTVIHKRERPPCVIADPHNLNDEVWIPTVAQQGWLIITRDSHIKDHHAEIAAVRANHARMVALSGDDARTTWDQLEIVMTQWRRIEGLLELPGPLIYTATRTTLRKVI
jgi:hypothetical protein